MGSVQRGKDRAERRKREGKEKGERENGRRKEKKRREAFKEDGKIEHYGEMLERGKRRRKQRES